MVDEMNSCIDRSQREMPEAWGFVKATQSIHNLPGQGHIFCEARASSHRFLACTPAPLLLCVLYELCLNTLAQRVTQIRSWTTRR